MIKNLQDFLAGLLFLARGVGFGWVASRHPLGIAADMGSGYVPLLLGLLLGLLGLLILFKALTFEALGGGRVRRWGVAPLLRLLGGLFWLALCSGPSQWPWVGHWFESWPTLGLVAGVAGLVLAVVPGPGVTNAATGLGEALLDSVPIVALVGDGINDAFQPDIYGSSDYRLMILNRWGEIVYESKDKKILWDGTKNNQDCPEGVYAVILEYKSLRQSKRFARSSLTLMRPKSP